MRSHKLSVKVCKTWRPQHVTEADTVEVWTDPEGDDGMSDLDKGQARIPAVAHQMQWAQQVISLQISSLRSRCFSYYSTQHLQSLY